MNRYLFDLYNSNSHFLDDEGQLLKSRERARIEPVRVLHDVTRDETPDQKLVKLTVKVHSEASLILTSGWGA
jgi:hypothetical protein